MREASLDGLTSLLMLPMSRLSLVLQAAAYPWIAAATVAILLLPIYIFCVGLDGMTWPELASLYTLFGIASVALPGFRRPALSGSIAATMLNQAIDNPNTEPDATKLPFPANPVVGQDSGRRSRWVGVIPAFFILLSIFAGFGRGQIYGALADYVPDSILSLVPSSIISLPFMTARVLITPFAFFRWTVIPLPIVTTLVLVSKYLSLVRTSEFLSVGMYRDLASLATYRPRRTAELGFQMVLVLVSVGFMWAWVPSSRQRPELFSVKFKCQRCRLSGPPVSVFLVSRGMGRDSRGQGGHMDETPLEFRRNTADAQLDFSISLLRGSFLHHRRHYRPQSFAGRQLYVAVALYTDLSADSSDSDCRGSYEHWSASAGWYVGARWLPCNRGRVMGTENGAPAYLSQPGAWNNL